MKFILLYRQDLTNRYPLTTVICGAALTVLLACLLRAWGVL